MTDRHEKLRETAQSVEIMLIVLAVAAVFYLIGMVTTKDDMLHDCAADGRYLATGGTVIYCTTDNALQ